MKIQVIRANHPIQRRWRKRADHLKSYLGRFGRPISIGRRRTGRMVRKRHAHRVKTSGKAA